MSVSVYFIVEFFFEFVVVLFDFLVMLGDPLRFATSLLRFSIHSGLEHIDLLLAEKHPVTTMLVALVTLRISRRAANEALRADTVIGVICSADLTVFGVIWWAGTSRWV
jgi:hypothetical protein